MKNCVRQKHITLQLKLKKQLIYNYYATIPWVLQLLCNYHYYKSGVEFISLNHYGTLKVK
jgi:hypothetical protein